MPLAPIKGGGGIKICVPAGIMFTQSIQHTMYGIPFLGKVSFMGLCIIIVTHWVTPLTPDTYIWHHWSSEPHDCTSELESGDCWIDSPLPNSLTCLVQYCLNIKWPVPTIAERYQVTQLPLVLSSGLPSAVPVHKYSFNFDLIAGCRHHRDNEAANQGSADTRLSVPFCLIPNTEGLKSRYMFHVMSVL